MILGFLALMDESSNFGFLVSKAVYPREKSVNGFADSYNWK